MTRLLFLKVLTGFMLVMPLSLVAAEDEREWRRVKNKNEIEVFRSHSENTRFKSFKAVTTIELDNIQSFVGILLDGEGYKSWMHMLRFSKISSTEDADKFEWFSEYRLPWPVKDRRMKTGYTISQREDYSIRIDFSPPKEDAEPGGGYIVVPEATGFWEVQTIPDSKKVIFTAEVFVDPGGFIPAFLVNLITDDISYFSAKKFRKTILLEKYQNYETDLVERRPWLEQIQQPLDSSP